MPANAAVPQRRRIERVRRAERRPAATEAWARILFVPPHLLMMLFLVALVLPVGISLAGLQLTPYNCVLLVFLAPAVLYWLQHAPRVIALDIFMMLYILWIGVAIYHNHGNSRLVFIVNQSVTLFGAYLLGRVLVRDPASHRLMFSCLFWILLVLFPFAVFELIFNKSIIQTIFGLPHTSAGMRLGMRRVLSVFPHPILFGVFCSIMVSNFFYIFYERTHTRMGRTLLAVAMTFMSLSTGPNLAQLGQLILIAWERLFRFFVTKWYVLVVAAASLLSIGQMAYPGGIYAFIVDNLAFDQHTGWGRMEILVYGSQTVAQNPIYGIGLNAWNGPWWRSASVDNFWLVTAMRYGIPALAFIWAGLAWHAVRIISRSGLTEQAASYRKGYVFASAGLVFVLASVHIWAAVAVFVMFYIGAGAWFYIGDAALEPVQRRERSRTQPLPTPAAPITTPATTLAAGRASGAGRAIPHRATARQDLRR